MTNTQPLVSVFLPTYNQEKYIGAAIESALSQDYGNIEIIVGDDCSRDATWTIVETYRDQYPDQIRAFRNPENLGVTGNCNEVLKRCAGQYIAFHAGDDIWLPQKLRKQIELMVSDPGCVLTYHDVEVFQSDTDQVLYTWNTGKGRPAPVVGKCSRVARTLVERTAAFLAALSVVIRRSSLSDEARYDDRLPYLSELSLWLQVLHGNQGTVRYIPEVLARYRKHAAGISQRNHETEFDVFLALVESEYPSLLNSVRKARARRNYSKGVRKALSNDRQQALVYLYNSLRQATVSPRVVYWMLRVLSGRKRRHVDHNEGEIGVPITEKSYWDNLHVEKGAYRRRDFHDYRRYCDKLILKAIKQFYHGGVVLEVGAGGSDWLIDLSSELNPALCVGLDYSELGCKSLSEKSESAGANIDIVHADLFQAPAHLVRSANFVLSFGVVEHFTNLPEVLRATSQYAAPGGIVFTLIPNMTGVNGLLTKLFNRKTYDIHVPHDLRSFTHGHRQAGLEILWAAYLGSSNFGVLSSCFEERRGLKYWLYKQLTRLSKVIWFAESRLGPLPATRLVSPYIVVASRVSR